MFNNLSGILPVTEVGGNNGGNGWGNGEGWWVIILFALIFGWGRNGWGNNASDGGSCCSPASCADLQRGFDNQTTQMRFNGIDQGICSLGYDNAVQINGVNSNIAQTGFAIQNAITQMGINNMQSTNALQSQLQDCCCENRAAIAQVRYDMATDTCAIRTDMNQGFAMLDRTINEKFCELEMNRLREQNAEKDAIIAAQNNRISNDAQTQTLINTLRPCPSPAYITCNPWASNGTAFNGCCGNSFGGCC